MFVPTIRTHATRLIVGAVAAAAVAVPMYASLTSPDVTAQAGPKCLAWFGNQEDGHCLGYSNGTPAAIGTPGVAFGNGGITTGPLLPGTSFNSNFG